MKIGIIVAMESERQLLLNSLGKNDAVQIGECEWKVVKSGIGKVNAALCAAQLIDEFQPDILINTGVAGACGARLKPLDVVVARECCYHDVWCGEPNQKGQVQELPARFTPDEKFLEKATALGAIPVLLCTGDIFAGKEDVQRIQKDFPECEAVDMESAAIAQCCYLKNVPFLSLRVISDNADTDDNASQYENFWDRAPQATFSILKQLLTL